MEGENGGHGDGEEGADEEEGPARDEGPGRLDHLHEEVELGGWDVAGDLAEERGAVVHD